MRRAITTLAAVAVFTLPAGASAAGTLQPGSYHETNVGACTLNFVFDGAGAQLGKTYFATAAHCVEKVGEPIYDFDGDQFGTVAVIGNEDRTEDDWALIEVLPGHVGRVSPAVAGHPGYPTGYTVSSDTSTGDRIQFSGWGLGYDLTQPTRERRFGLLTYDDSQIFEVAGLMNWGDSGGPLVHVPTGRALGIESRVCIGVCTDEGPTTQGMLAKAAARGYSLTLRTAG